MIKLKFRNTRENLPTVKVDDLDASGLFDQFDGVPCSQGDQIILKLVNVGGITSDLTLTCLDDEATYKADGWNTYLFPLERNNKPFEVGVCAAFDGTEWPAKEAEEEEFEEFDEEEDSADEEGFDDSDEDDFDDSDDEEEAPAPTPIRAATARTVTVVAAAPVARAAQAPEKKTYKTDVSSADILAAFYDNSENKAAAARELNMSPRTFGRRLEQARAERRTRSKPAAKKTPAKSSKNKRAASKKNGSKKRR